MYNIYLLPSTTKKVCLFHPSFICWFPFKPSQKVMDRWGHIFRIDRLGPLWKRLDYWAPRSTHAHSFFRLFTEWRSCCRHYKHHTNTEASPRLWPSA